VEDPRGEGPHEEEPREQQQQQGSDNQQDDPDYTPERDPDGSDSGWEPAYREPLSLRTFGAESRLVAGQLRGLLSRLGITKAS
jgi:hypothetical protein